MRPVDMEGGHQADEGGNQADVGGRMRPVDMEAHHTVHHKVQPELEYHFATCQVISCYSCYSCYYKVQPELEYHFRDLPGIKVKS